MSSLVTLAASVLRYRVEEQTDPRECRQSGQQQRTHTTT